MKRLIFIAVVCAFVAAPALADPKVKMHISGLGDYRTGSGGEFAVEILNTTEFNSALGVVNVLDLYADSTKNQHVTPSFHTFCVETDESISDHAIHEATFESYAIGGGSGGAIDMGLLGWGDPLSQGAAFLYEQFAKGLLPTSVYDYSPGSDRATAAGQLQLAIWTLEEEWAKPSDSSTAYGWGNISDAIKTFLAGEFDSSASPAESMLAGWRQDNNGQYAVTVMNLWSIGAQSQLVLIPVPAAVLLGFLGLGAAGMKLRKFS